MIRGLIISLLLLAFLTGSAWACACCADRGVRNTLHMSFTPFEVEELARLEAGSDAILYQTACGLDCVSGIQEPQHSYELYLDFAPGQVVFDMGPRGAMVFEMPNDYVRSDVDTDPTAPGADPLVYTELPMVGVISGSGDFADVGPNQAVLVVSGFGNLCLMADALEHWSLQVSEDQVNFQLFGALQAR
jgi:hypothetical protein